MRGVGRLGDCGQKKAGASWAPAIVGSASLRLLRQQHVARVLDRTRNGPLVLGAQARVFAGQDLARVRDEAHPGRGIRERNLRGCGCLLLGFVSAHGCGKFWKGDRGFWGGFVNAAVFRPPGGVSPLAGPTWGSLERPIAFGYGMGLLLTDQMPCRSKLILPRMTRGLPVAGPAAGDQAAFDTGCHAVNRMRPRHGPDPLNWG